MFYLTMHSTHFIYGYMASDIWLSTILMVRKEIRCRHIGYSFRLAARVLTERIAHTMAFVTPVVEHWLEREIAQWVHPMKDRFNDPSHHERTLLPRSYISLQIARKETRCCHYMGYSFQLTARVLFLYAPYHRKDITVFVTPVVEHWLEGEIAQWDHHEESI